MLEKIHVSLIERRAWIERDVFQHAPADWASFQERFGQWKVTTELIKEVEDLIKGIEDEDDKVPGHVQQRNGR